VRHNLEELNRNADLPALVGRYVEFDRFRSNGRDLWARCPFHSERTASFHVYQDRGLWRWHCFGACAAGGDALDFLERVGMSNAHAIDVLGGAGLAPDAALKTGLAARADNSERIERALSIWKRTQPLLGTLGKPIFASGATFAAIVLQQTSDTQNASTMDLQNARLLRSSPLFAMFAAKSTRFTSFIFPLMAVSLTRTLGAARALLAQVRFG